MTKNWMDEAACKNMEPEIFFTDTRRQISEEAQLALKTCNRCPVKKQCLDENIREMWGIWGGTTAEERQSGRVAFGKQVSCKICGTIFYTKSNNTLCSQKCQSKSRVISKRKYEASR
jgi:hypothetical protein